MRRVDQTPPNNEVSISSVPEKGMVRAVKKASVSFLITVLLFISSGCATNSAILADVQRIALFRCIPDFPKLEVFVVSSEYAVEYYDFTTYWTQNVYDYFSDPLPPENEYTSSELRITEDDWNQIVEALRQNRFLALPETLRPVNGYDFPTIYIEIEAGGVVHKSGGYGAGYNGDRLSRRFKNILDVIEACLEVAGAF